MKCFVACLLILFVSGCGSKASPEPEKKKETLVAGLSVDVFVSKLAAAGYKESAGLEIIPTQGDALKFWQVGQGVLAVDYSLADKKVSNMSYYLCDERPKMLRNEFVLVVTEIDLSSGQMQMKLPEGRMPSTQATSVSIER